MLQHASLNDMTAAADAPGGWIRLRKEELLPKKDAGAK